MGICLGHPQHLLQVTNTHGNVLEAHADDEVGGPVGEAGHGHGRRPRTLREQLGHEEPGDGAGADLEERHEAEDGQHADVAHPRNAVLSGEEEEEEEGIKTASGESRRKRA